MPISSKLQTMIFLGVTGIIVVISIAVGIILSPIWIPVLLINLPWMIFVALLLKFTKLGDIVNAQILKTYDWALYKSNKPRKYMWSVIYNCMCLFYPQTKWKAMNYGYACLTENGKLIQNLSVEDEDERFSLQLYHYIATEFSQLKNLNSKNILEVGCGRGGGLRYVTEYLKPENCIGVDYSENQVEFCKATYKELSNLTFYHGDAENLQAIKDLKENTFDAVINIESSHCYGDFNAFLQQVKLMLKPGGHFLFTDFRAIQEKEQLETDLKNSGMKIKKQEDITINIEMALKQDDKRRTALIDDNVTFMIRPFFKKFSGVQGTRIFEEFRKKETLYLAYILEKPS